MSDFDVLMADAHRLGMEDFVKLHPYPVLISLDAGKSKDVYIVHKRTDSTFTQRIAIGRSAGNDVCIPYDSVSKFHAYIDISHAPTTYRIADSKSSNGTMLGTTPVKPHELVVLPNMSQLTLGSHVFAFLLPEQCYVHLHRNAYTPTAAPGTPGTPGKPGAPADPAKAPTLQAEKKDPPPKGQRQKPLLLLVDDDATVIRVMPLALAKQYLVRTSTSAIEAVRDARRFDPDAIVLDVRMTGKDGFWVFAEIRKFNTTVPIIMHSAYQDRMDERSANDAFRPFAYLHKSGKISELFAVLEKALASVNWKPAT